MRQATLFAPERQAFFNLRPNATGISTPKALLYLSKRYGVPIVSRREDLTGLKVVYFSLHSFRDFYALADLWRSRPWGQTWIAGGNAATNPTGIMHLVDYVFIGEAFQAFGEILAGNYDIPGMVKTDDPRPTRYHEEPLIREPLRDGELMISKGCPRRCAFCVHGFRESYEEVPREIALDYARTYRGRGIYFASNSSSDVSYYEELTDVLRDSEKTDMAISSALQATTDAMVAGRRREMLFGIEGMSEELRRIANKPIPQATLIERISSLLAGGMQVRTVYQFNLPGENEADFDEFMGDLHEITERAGSGSLAVPFIPNQTTPHTPFQWQRPYYSVERVEEIMRLRSSLFGQKMNGVSVFVPAPLYPRSWFRQTLAEWLPVTPQLDKVTAKMPNKAPVSEFINRCLDHGLDASHIFTEKTLGFEFPWAWISVRESEESLWRFASIVRNKLQRYGRM